MLDRWLTRSALLGAALALQACGDVDGGAGRSDDASFADASVSRLEALGWLGARAHPLTRPLTIDVEGEPLAPGGLVLRELAPEAPLARAGARPGDVLVRVGEHWLPLAEDPTLDMLSFVEQEVSAGKTELALAVWRDGALVELALASEQPALEVGLPVEVERFRRGALAAAEWLAREQREDGGFPAPAGASELALDALASLAFLSAGADDESASEPLRSALAKAEARIDALVAEAATDADALGLALALAFEAERIGPLPPEILLRAAPRVVAFSAGAPDAGAAPPDGSSMVFFSTGLAEGAPEQHVPEGAEVQTITLGEGGSFELPEGLELPEGMELEIAGMLEGIEAGALELAEGAQIAPPPSADLAALLDELDPERKLALEGLGAIAARLLATQAEDGSFGAAGEAEAARLIPTALALASLGAAQRVGLELEPEPIERGCAFLRTLVHDGKVAGAVARGADRRDEAGRAAAAAHAFLALGCPDTDELVQSLVQYSTDAGRHVLGASSAISFHVLATALLRRGLDLVTWARFYDEFRIALVAWQEPDGSFRIPAGRGEGAAAAWPSSPLFDTAVGAIVLGVQSEPLPVLLGNAENPFAPAIDGEGKRAGAAADDAEAEGEAAAVEAIDPAAMQELLDSMGIEGDVEITIEGEEKDGRR